jgi:hypothetical protein
MATANPAGIPSPNPAPTGFQRVLAKFSTRLTPEEVQDFQFTTLNDVHQVIVNIQEQQARGRGMRNLTRVLRFVEAMDEFGKVVEVFLNTSSLLAFIWGPIKLLLQVYYLSASRCNFPLTLMLTYIGRSQVLGQIHLILFSMHTSR